MESIINQKSYKFVSIFLYIISFLSFILLFLFKVLYCFLYTFYCFFKPLYFFSLSFSKARTYTMAFLLCFYIAFLIVSFILLLALSFSGLVNFSIFVRPVWSIAQSQVICIAMYVFLATAVEVSF